MCVAGDGDDDGDDDVVVVVAAAAAAAVVVAAAAAVAAVVAGLPGSPRAGISSNDASPSEHAAARPCRTVP